MSEITGIAKVTAPKKDIKPILRMNEPVHDLYRQMHTDSPPDNPLGPNVSPAEITMSGDEANNILYYKKKLSLPEVTDRFTLHGHLGGGTIAEVFQATDKKTKERLVLKILTPSRMGDRIVSADFREESLYGNMLASEQIRNDGFSATPVQKYNSPYIIAQTEAYEGVSLLYSQPYTPEETIDSVDQMLRVIESLNKIGKTAADLQQGSLRIKKTPFHDWQTKVQIIDWNTLGQLDPQRTESPTERESNINPKLRLIRAPVDDVRRIASYACTMLGKPLNEYPLEQSKILDNLRDSQMPKALQLIVARALSPDLGYRFNTASQFRETINLYKDLLQSNPSQLIDRGKRLCDKFSERLEVDNYEMQMHKPLFFKLALIDAILQDIKPYLPETAQNEVSTQIRRASKHVSVADPDYYRAKIHLAKHHEPDAVIPWIKEAQKRTGGIHVGRLLAVAEALKKASNPQIYDQLFPKGSHRLLEQVSLDPQKANEAFTEAGLTKAALASQGFDFLNIEISIREKLAHPEHLSVHALEELERYLTLIPYGQELNEELNLSKTLNEPRAREKMEKLAQTESDAVRKVFTEIVERQIDRHTLAQLILQAQASKHEDQFMQLIEANCKAKGDEWSKLFKLYSGVSIKSRSSSYKNKLGKIGRDNILDVPPDALESIEMKQETPRRQLVEYLGSSKNPKLAREAEILDEILQELNDGQRNVKIDGEKFTISTVKNDTLYAWYEWDQIRARRQTYIQLAEINRANFVSNKDFDTVRTETNDAIKQLEQVDRPYFNVLSAVNDFGYEMPGGKITKAEYDKLVQIAEAVKENRILDALVAVETNKALEPPDQDNKIYNTPRMDQIQGRLATFSKFI